MRFTHESPDSWTHKPHMSVMCTFASLEDRGRTNCPVGGRINEAVKCWCFSWRTFDRLLPLFHNYTYTCCYGDKKGLVVPFFTDNYAARTRKCVCVCVCDSSSSNSTLTYRYLTWKRSRRNCSANTRWKWRENDRISGSLEQKYKRLMWASAGK